MVRQDEGGSDIKVTIATGSDTSNPEIEKDVEKNLEKGPSDSDDSSGDIKERVMMATIYRLTYA
jgi:hypothetical protein